MRRRNFLKYTAVGTFGLSMPLVSCQSYKNMSSSSAYQKMMQSFTYWIFAALLTLLFPIAIKNFDAGYIFAFSAFMMVLQLVWVKFMVPETKGRSLEEIEKKLGTN